MISDDAAANASETVFPDAYRRDQRRGPTVYLPNVRPWLWALLAVTSALVAASWPVWLRATAGARALVERILDLL